MAVVADPVGVIPQHISLLKLARKRLDMLLVGDGAFGIMGFLDTTIHRHHVLYLRLMPQCKTSPRSMSTGTSLST
jgi:hypothetical protein